MKKVMIIFGGKSGEHEVSVNSALSIEKNIDTTQFKTYAIGIAHDGSWVFANSVAELVSDGKVTSNGSLPLPHKEVLELLFDADILFPIIHGTNGEDGTIQGLFEIANKPYVGSGVLGSAVSMDKIVQKQICSTAGIPQTDFTYFTKKNWTENQSTITEIINDQLSYPLFVKPANLGSSVGISKVKKKEALVEAINEAFTFDRKLIVEASIEEILEIEIAILGNEDAKASVCGSIKPNTEFYDYETKYVTDDITSQIPADIPKNDAQLITDLALQTYALLNCEGLARIDFFYQKTTGEVFLNEVNTLPGFTKISMYPKLWEKSGISYTDLITKLLKLAEQSWKEKQTLQYTY